MCLLKIVDCNAAYAAQVIFSGRSKEGKKEQGNQ
jgi:hypothetical protein